MDEVKERLEEEERQCQVSLKNLWDDCESCLESTCMRYHTTCKHGLSTFRRKVGRNFVSGKYSWIHLTVLERAHLTFSIPRSASCIRLLKLIWFGGSGNVKLYGRDYMQLYSLNIEPKWVPLHPGVTPWTLIIPLTPTESLQIHSVVSHSRTCNKKLSNCLWKIPHRFFMVYLKISRVKSVDIVSKIPWGKKIT